MHYSPCGRAVDWIQFPFEVWARLHTSPDAPLVRLRWVYTDQPFLPVGTQSVVNNRIWDFDHDSDLSVGQEPIEESDFDQDARLRLPALAFSGHMCHPEWFATGEPWPVPSTLPPTKYLAGWIPECCVVCCEFVDCLDEPVNGGPASELRQYAIPAKDATPTTPFLEHTVANVVVPTVPPLKGYTISYNPLGTMGPFTQRTTHLVNNLGVPVSTVTEFIIDDENFATRTLDANGLTETVAVGGSAAGLTLFVVGGVGELGGFNIKLASSLLPDSVTPRTTTAYAAAGTTQATATAITTTGAQLTATATTQGAIVPLATATGNRILSVVHLSTSAVASLNLYPGTGQAFSARVANAPIILNRGTGVMLIENVAENGGWAVVPF